MTTSNSGAAKAGIIDHNNTMAAALDVAIEQQCIIPREYRYLLFIIIPLYGL